MTSKDIAQFIGKSVFWRKIGYALITVTTLREWYIKTKLAKILKRQNDNFSFLDAGSGIGQHAIAISEKYDKAKVDGIEQDQEQVEDCNYYVRKTGKDNIRFFQGDLANLENNEKYDVMLCSSVLEHIDQDVKVMESFHEHLNDEGHALIYVPQSEQRVIPSLGKTMQKMVDKAGEKYPHGHVRYYKPEELHSKLTSVGFDIVDSVITYGKFGRFAYDIVTTVQYSKYFKLLFPFYFVFVHPFVMLLMLADFLTENKEGNGLLVVAQKRTESTLQFA
jgi:2-polyprenyl-3-methyl-5-hydroxy-6-metoxy-1,4-benzoquinol methylase